MTGWDYYLEEDLDRIRESDVHVAHLGRDPQETLC